VRAALVSAHGAVPELGDRPAPEAADGKAVVELLAAALNPADLAIASGSFPAGSPPLPYVPGIEGVGRIVQSGRLAPGTRVWASGRGLGVAADGAFSERFAVAEEALFAVPDGADDVAAAAFGQAGLAAWMPLSWLAPVRAGESVLVLGATGSVGTVAVQAAKLLGAGRVVAAGRDEARLAAAAGLGADATVTLEGEDLAGRLTAAFEGSPPTLVIDALWGPAVEAAATVAAPGARIVNLGQSAGPVATFPSGQVRGKQLQIFGYSNFAVPGEVLARGYAELVDHASAGRICLPVETLPLERVAEAWERQRDRQGGKIVLVAGAL
jgi:NADPH:quinone reductase-like Zn-dependent oxidoreductase